MNTFEDVDTIRRRFKAIEVELTGDTPERMNAQMAPQFVDLDLEKSTALIRYVKKEWEHNQRGELHGGAISAMLDTSMGMAICGFKDGDVTTADLAVSFIRPAVGGSFLVEAEVMHQGRSLARARAKMIDEDSGKLVATSTGTFARLR